jgi:hypothetical protein
MKPKCHGKQRNEHIVYAVTAARRGVYPGWTAIVDEVGAGLLAVGGVEEPHGGDLGGILVRVLLHARVEGVSCLAEQKGGARIPSAAGTEKVREESGLGLRRHGFTL